MCRKGREPHYPSEQKSYLVLARRVKSNLYVLRMQPTFFKADTFLVYWEKSVLAKFHKMMLL